MNKNQPVVGVRGLALDDAARSALDFTWVNLSIAEVVRDCLSANPNCTQGAHDLDPLLEQFIDH